MIKKEKDGYSVQIDNRRLTGSLSLEKAKQVHRVFDWLTATIVKAGDEVVYKGETRKVKSVKGDVVTIPGVGDVHKSKVLAPTKPVQDTRGFNLEETNPNKVNDDLLSDEVFDKDADEQH